MKRKVKGNICDTNTDRILHEDTVHITDDRFTDIETGKQGIPLYDEELYVTIGGLIYVYRFNGKGQEFIYEVGIDGAKEWAEKHGVKLKDEDLVRYGIPERCYLTPMGSLYLENLKQGMNIGSKIMEELLKKEYERKMGA